MRAYERLLRYAAVDTQSDESAGRTPSTEKQYAFAWLLRNEMQDLGMLRVYTDPSAYTYGFLPPSPEMKSEPMIGLIAHIDTAPDFSGAGVRPQVHKNYDGGALPLGDSGLVLRPEEFPDLRAHAGKTLITTDGTTLLGADDKAGVAEIMTLCEELLKGNRPHCAVGVCFTPDEEIGHGAAKLDFIRFGASFAYTVDGGPVEEINYETFNAASAVFSIQGRSVHPGSAKDVMVNASLVAMRINAMLPPEEIPARTEGYEGFYHLTGMSGDVSRAELKYIIRDHDGECFEARCERLREIEQALNAEYGEGTVELTLREQYRNMKELIEPHMFLIDNAKKAFADCGVEPVVLPIRGGTDGAMLTYRGLPCPNLSTGGHNFHSNTEYIPVQSLEKMADVLVELASLTAR